MTGATMLDAMRAAGLAPAKELNLRDDGKLTRYRVDGDKSGSRNGWAVLHSQPVMAGAFGSWKTGESHTWRETTTRPQTPAERAELAQRIKAMHAAREAEQVAVQASAADRAAKLWARAHPATNAHPYLQRKHVPAIGIRALRDMLLIPARDVAGMLHTLQFISPDGSKRFLSGGRIRGCYYAMGRPAGALLLAEGLATGSTLHLATGAAVAVCFNCNNLEPVAQALRGKFPELRLVICADDDRETPGNPGVTHATAAARAVGGFLAVPKFPEVHP
jgi:putative DNA primase/helicase